MQKASLSFAVVLLVTMYGCNNSSPTSSADTTTEPTTPATTATEANVTAAISGPTSVRRSGGNREYEARYRVRLDESAGVGARVSFVRLRLSAGSRTETSELGASSLRADYGTNTVPANGTWNKNLLFTFNMSDAQVSTMTVRLQDDLGTTLEADFDVTPPAPGNAGTGGGGGWRWRRRRRRWRRHLWQLERACKRRLWETNRNVQRWFVELFAEPVGNMLQPRRCCLLRLPRSAMSLCWTRVAPPALASLRSGSVET